MQTLASIELRIIDERIRAWGTPRYHSDMAAGVDLLACVVEPLVLEPQAAAVLVPSGISIHIGDPHIAGLIVPRSGLGHKQGLVLGNSTGVLDADFTGELMISCWNRSRPGSSSIVINPGDRIAQLLFVPILRPEIRIVDDFSRTTTRAGGGFGSTGHAHTAGNLPER